MATASWSCGLPIWIMWAFALAGIAGAIVCAIGALFMPRRPPSRRAGLMSPSTIGAIGVLALFAMLLLRVPVWIALTLVGFIGNIDHVRARADLCARRHGAVRRRLGLHAVGPAAVHPDGRSRLGDRAVRRSVQGRARHCSPACAAGWRSATLAASACFGAVCGSSVATAATMTRIALPEMRKAGYDAGLADRLASPPAAASAS